ncbi:MAG: DAK2 domain-containing protein [Chloroflexi bacterium]|nr:DAK2 domain-containing protein [Chloroflexota bacterium]
MLSRGTCDGPELLEAFGSAASHLGVHVDELNGLNVFPVPDGDTGSNMYSTVRAALDEARLLGRREVTLDRVAQALRFGSLMGARGNSGVILSQLFSGMAEGVDGHERFDGRDFARALGRGTQAAYRAVGRPVEGTILTVMREASAEAVKVSRRVPELEPVLSGAVRAAGQAVARTPSLLPVLREAGVVDAGGQGFYRVLEGALRHLRGEASAKVSPPLLHGASVPLDDRADGFGYETMFLVTASDAPLDLDVMRAAFNALGESVLVAGDHHAARVHVHNDRPDQVLAYGLSLGQISRVTVENLDSQVSSIEARAAVRLEMPDQLGAPERMEPTGSGPATHAGPSVVAVAPGDGIARLLQQLGASVIVRGGQGLNPSTAELLAALRTAPRAEVVLLPNNRNTALAARQAAELCPEKQVVVVSTRNTGEAVAALLAASPGMDLAGTEQAMTRAAGELQTIEITEAVRDAAFGERRLARGDAIALDADERLLAAEPDRQAAALAGVARLRPGFELLTIYRGSPVGAAEGEALAAALRAAHPGVEVDLVDGGQAGQAYLISAE